MQHLYDFRLIERNLFIEPQTIIDAAIPLLEGGFSNATGSNTNSVVSDSGAQVPQTNGNTTFPQAIIAQETISQSLNTETKAILAQYTFESLGAIKISSLTNPLANITISPNGIVATNASGVNTFTLSGIDGSGTFLGTLRAGTIIAGDNAIVMETASNGNGRIVFYNSGVPAILIGDPS